MGKLPGCAERLLGDILAPKVDWRDTLRRFVTERAKADYSWSRPNRRYMAQGIILPGLHSWQMGAIAVAVDTSGSIDAEQLAEFAAELLGIQEDAKPASMVALYCDAAVHRVDEFTPFDPFELRSAGGGGGSDFRPVFNAIAERGESPACLVYLTDGFGTFPDSPPDYPVLWVMNSDADAPFGEVVRL
jgi:predicted metal-dependent peptidase